MTELIDRHQATLMMIHLEKSEFSLCKFMDILNTSIKELVRSCAANLYGYSGSFIFVALAEARVGEARKINSHISSHLHFRDAYVGRFRRIHHWELSDKVNRFPDFPHPIEFLTSSSFSFPHFLRSSSYAIFRRRSLRIRVISIYYSIVKSIRRTWNT